jgi:hypothetical protein
MVGDRTWLLAAPVDRRRMPRAMRGRRAELGNLMGGDLASQKCVCGLKCGLVSAVFRETQPNQQIKCERWRRGRDSNPRNSYPFSSFQDWRLKPLGHPSGPARPLLRRSHSVQISASGARFQPLLCLLPVFCFRKWKNCLFPQSFSPQSFLIRPPRIAPSSRAPSEPRMFSAHTTARIGRRDGVHAAR